MSKTNLILNFIIIITFFFKLPFTYTIGLDYFLTIFFISNIFIIFIIINIIFFRFVIKYPKFNWDFLEIIKNFLIIYFGIVIFLMLILISECKSSLFNNIQFASILLFWYSFLIFYYIYSIYNPHKRHFNIYFFIEMLKNVLILVLLARIFSFYFKLNFSDFSPEFWLIFFFYTFLFCEKIYSFQQKKTNWFFFVERIKNILILYLFFIILLRQLMLYGGIVFMTDITLVFTIGYIVWFFWKNRR
jgi:hypothetical protein